MPIIPTDAIKDPSPQLQVVLRWIDALITTRDLKALEGTITEDYTHHVLPKSLGRPLMKKPAFLEYGTFVMTVLPEFNATIYEVVESPGKLVLHASSSGTTVTEYPYANEYVTIVHVAKPEDGDYRISSIREFLDSKYTSESFPKERKRQEEAAKKAQRN